jgi:hypothetical protein
MEEKKRVWDLCHLRLKDRKHLFIFLRGGKLIMATQHTQHEYEGTEYHREIRRRKAEDLWVTGPLTIRLRSKLTDAGFFWWNSGWLAPNRESQQMFLGILAGMEQQEEKVRSVVVAWHQALFGGDQTISASELDTARQLLGSFGEESIDLVVVLAGVVRHRWPRCVQLISAVRFYLDEAVKIRTDRDRKRRAAIKAAEEHEADAKETEARQAAMQLWNSMPAAAQAGIEQRVMMDPKMADIVKQKSFGYMQTVRNRCIDLIIANT